ncbi:MAG: hypothetical protein WA828_00990 [Coleofasciculaceae cyanobacterium]
MWVTSPDTALTPTTVALGNFDGVHRGHQQVIKPILRNKSVTPVTVVPPSQDQQRLANCQEIKSHVYSTVATFTPHPREFFSKTNWKFLTPRAEKVLKLKSLGVEQLALLPFNQELASLSPEQFVEKILVQQLQATQVSVGEDFQFGYKRSGRSSDLKAIAS